MMAACAVADGRIAITGPVDPDRIMREVFLLE